MLLPLAGAVIAMCLNAVLPLISSLLLALVLGAIVANTPLGSLDAVRDHAPVTKALLRWGVVLLGLKLPVSEVLGLGFGGVLVIVATVAVTFGATVLIGRWMRLERGFVTLLASGFSVCGAAAIAAVEDAVGARRRDVTLAVALVTIFGSLMILALPPLASMLGLTAGEAAIWAGASIHEVAQVVAAASVVGGSAVALATTVKLGRVALLAPVYAVAARLSRSHTARQAPVLPWFVIGFAVAVAVRSLVPLPHELLSAIDLLTTFLLAAGMFGLGLGLRMRELWPIPIRAFGLAAASTSVAAATSLGLVLLVA